MRIASESPASTASIVSCAEWATAIGAAAAGPPASAGGPHPKAQATIHATTSNRCSLRLLRGSGVGPESQELFQAIQSRNEPAQLLSAHAREHGALALECERHQLRVQAP